MQNIYSAKVAKDRKSFHQRFWILVVMLIVTVATIARIIYVGIRQGHLSEEDTKTDLLLVQGWSGSECNIQFSTVPDYMMTLETWSDVNSKRTMRKVTGFMFYNPSISRISKEKYWLMGRFSWQFDTGNHASFEIRFPLSLE